MLFKYLFAFTVMALVGVVLAWVMHESDASRNHRYETIDSFVRGMDRAYQVIYENGMDRDSTLKEMDHVHDSLKQELWKINHD